MVTIERQHVQAIVQLVQAGSTKRIVAITGPRQTGKTTIALTACRLLRDRGYGYWYVALDDPSRSDYSIHGASHNWETVPMGAVPDVRWLTKLWERARREAFRSQRLVLVLDEIQLIPDWSTTVKGLWDGDRRTKCPLHVVILGSAPWRMLTGLSEGLVGRFDALPVTHWLLQEMRLAFGLSLDEYLFFGGYPGAMVKEFNRTRLATWRNHVARSIVAPAMDRDIIGLTRVAKPALLRRLIELAPMYSGQIMSHKKLLGQLTDRGNSTTIARYLDLLSDAGLVAGLTRYTPAPHLGRASPPKLNVLNTALMTSLFGYTFEEARNDRTYWGRIVESAVGAHLYNTADTATKVYYWRDKNGKHEVDFVLARGPHLLGLEVKSGRLKGRSGLNAFSERFDNAKTAIVGTGGIPLSKFLSQSADHWLEEL